MVILERFFYFQGTLLTYLPDFICNGNSLLDSGYDESAYPLICEDDFQVITSPGICAKKYSQEVSVCRHDMFLQNNQCHLCDMYYGNEDSGACTPCEPACFKCSGHSMEKCTVCRLGFGFTGSGCFECNWESQTFDSLNNICVDFKERFVDLTEASPGQVQIYFRPLEEFADSNVHVSLLFAKYYYKDLTPKYYLTREYTGLRAHNKVTIDFDIIFIDLDNNDKLMVAVDGEYIHLVNNFFDDVDNLSQFWGDTAYLDSSYPVHVLLEHSAATLTLGISSFASYGKSFFMIHNLRMATFGCHYTCLTCSKDESSLHCTSCESGRFLSLASNRCIACSSNCLTCDNSPFECTACKPGSFLDSSTRECLSDCPTGFFGNASGVCQACDVSCTSCETASTHCTSCLDPALFAENGSCVASCSIGKYLNNGQCLDCQTGCIVCNDDTDCVNCDFGSGFLKKGIRA